MKNNIKIDLQRVDCVDEVWELIQDFACVGNINVGFTCETVSDHTVPLPAPWYMGSSAEAPAEENGYHAAYCVFTQMAPRSIIQFKQLYSLL
jgi:hypothetical protein